MKKHPPPSLRANRAPSPCEWQQPSLPFGHTLYLNERHAASVEFFFCLVPHLVYSALARFASLTNSVAEIIDVAISDMRLRLS